MVIPGEARLTPVPKIKPEPVEPIDKGGTDKSVVCVKKEKTVQKNLQPYKESIKLHTYICFDNSDIDA